MNPMYLPDAKKLSDLFPHIEPYDAGKKAGRWDTDGNRGLIFCNVSGGGKSFLVQPSAEVVKVVTNALKIVFDENIYFTIVIRDNGTALITAQYNLIIGSRWLVVLPLTEISALL